MNTIDDPMTGLLEKLLDVSSRRQMLIAGNIANVDTPGYQTRDLDFEAAMRAAAAGTDSGRIQLETTAPGHLAPRQDTSLLRFELEPGDLPRRNDLNNVSIDREMLGLAKSSGRYATAIELLRKRFALLKYAIMEGRSG